MDLLSYRNGTSNTGANLNETILTPANVNATTFGKLMRTGVDGRVYAQPVYKSAVNITSGATPGIHNVVYVVTEHDSLYAIDADNGQINGRTVSSILRPASLRCRRPMFSAQLRRRKASPARR